MFVYYKLYHKRKQYQCSYKLSYNLQVNNISVLLCTLTNQMTITTLLSRQPCEQSHWLSQIPVTKIIGVIDIGSLH